jgi:hypothetical protein
VPKMFRCARALVLAGLGATVGACGLLGETETYETVRGRLKFVQKATATGTYGDEKSHSISDGDFRFAGSRVWSLGSFLGCSPSPNEAREAFVCQRHQEMRERIDVVAVVGGKPRAVSVYDGDLRDSTAASPAWVGDREGRWLFFRDFLYDVETAEKRRIKGAPGHYDAEFRAASPDAERVVYQLRCMGTTGESETEKQMDALCADADARKLDVLWLVEVRTGAVEVRTLGRSDEARPLPELAWERDGNGRFQPRTPRAETR